MVPPLMPHAHKSSPLHKVTNCGGTADVRRVLQAHLEARVGVDQADDAGSTALHIAVKGGHRKAVELLLQAGADVRVPRSNP